jgi:hypothetical protein
MNGRTTYRHNTKPPGERKHAKQRSKGDRGLEKPQDPLGQMTLILVRRSSVVLGRGTGIRSSSYEKEIETGLEGEACFITNRL